jgi:hypothetical protein
MRVGKEGLNRNFRVDYDRNFRVDYDSVAEEKWSQTYTLV